ncbi:MAG: shikimate kinase [Bacteroidales bacterium]|nr:shikimate kinase [Bacteroidales bacterium]
MQVRQAKNRLSSSNVPAMILSLTGFMGCGKSSIGKVLQSRLGCRLIDLDDYIEAKAGKKIPDIFKDSGEPAFRKMEADALREIIGRENGNDTVILSLGGGAVMTPECFDLVKKHTKCVYLRATIDTLVATLSGYEAQRPMLKGDEDLRTKVSNLMAKRASTYEAAASYITDIDGISYEDTADDIIKYFSL